MKKIGILGGSFNPPHQGHIHISNLAIKKLRVNQIWWIPTQQNPFKRPNNFLNYTQKIENCLSITKDYNKIKVIKIDNFYSFDLVNLLQKKYRNFKFIWIMGDDNLPEFHKWYNFKKLIYKIEFAIFSRCNLSFQNHNSVALKFYKKHSRSHRKLPKITLFNNPKMNISSTQIRYEKQK